MFSSTLELATEDQHPTLGTRCHKGVVARQYFLLFMHRVLLVTLPAMERKLKIDLFPLLYLLYYSAEDFFVQFAP